MATKRKQSKPAPRAPANRMPEITMPAPHGAGPVFTVPHRHGGVDYPIGAPAIFHAPALAKLRRLKVIQG